MNDIYSKRKRSSIVPACKSQRKIGDPHQPIVSVNSSTDEKKLDCCFCEKGQTQPLLLREEHVLPPMAFEKLGIDSSESQVSLLDRHDNALSCIADLCNDAMALIVHFCFGDDLEYITKDLPFLHLSLVSKQFQQSVLRFIQCTPLKFPGHLKQGQIACVCRNRMKLGELTFYTISQLDMAILLYIMNSCDVTSLKSISLKTYVPEEKGMQRGGHKKSDAIKIGIAKDQLDDAMLLTVPQFQISLAKITKEKCERIRKMTLEFRMRDFHVPLLTNVAHSLRTLVLYNGGEGVVENHADCVGEIMEAIAMMPHLENLVLFCFGNVAYVESSTVLRLKLHCNIIVDDLRCPNLKELEIGLRPDTLGLDVLRECPSKSSIEDLLIHIEDSEGVPRNSLCTQYFEELGKIIEEMPRLRKLKLRTRIPSEMSIKSSSLKVIDMTETSTMTLVECICPSLEEVIIECLPISHGVESFQKTLVPVDPFAEDDFDPSSYPSIVRDGCRRFEVGEKPFVGMQVPASCKVHIYGMFF